MRANYLGITVQGNTEVLPTSPALSYTKGCLYFLNVATQEINALLKDKFAVLVMMVTKS